MEEYIPNPLRCINCFRYGHTKNHCKRQKICARCGQDSHETSSCNFQIQCVSCKGPHYATAKECPKWLEEKEIQKIKIQQRIPYPEARKIVENQKTHPTVNSYSETLKTGLKKQNKNAETQTNNIPELYFKDKDGSFHKWEGKNINTTSSNPKNVCTEMNQNPQFSKKETIQVSNERI